MTTLILIVHVTVCFALIAIVLLQTGKGAEIGATFGGSNQTIFGSQGASTFLSKVTTAAAILFMVTSLSLAYFSSKKTGSVMRGSAPPPPVESPASSAEEKAPPVPADIPTEPVPEAPALPAPPPSE